MSPFAPDKKHLHHRLLNIGHSHRQSVLIMYLWEALFAGIVVSLSLVRTSISILLGLTVVAVLVLLFVTMPRLRPRMLRAGPDVAVDVRHGDGRGIPGRAAPHDRVSQAGEPDGRARRSAVPQGSGRRGPRPGLRSAGSPAPGEPAPTVPLLAGRRPGVRGAPPP